jgi:hypothetical protein
MSYTMIKHCKMDWEMETHKFTFVTGGDSLTALDSLGDLIGSLKDLYKEIAEGGIYNDDLPMEIKVEGGQLWTDIKS